MENNTVPQITPVTPVVPVTPPTVQPQPIQENIVPEVPKKNYTKIIILVTILVLIVGTVVYFLTKPKSGIIKTTYEKNGTTFTNYQYDDVEQKTLNTSCFTSSIPKSAKVESSSAGDCTIQLVMPDTTLPFVTVIAIDENDSQNVRDVVYAHDAEYMQMATSGNGVYDSKISENVNFGGFNSFILNYYDGSVNKSSYYIEVPESAGYKANGLAVRAFFINGFANDPSIDVFSKYFTEFITNLKFK